MDIKELAKIVKLCKAHGVTYIKTPDVELKIELQEAVEKRQEPTETAPPKTYSEEDALYWSSGPVL
jgi:hypothetical protein